MRYNFIKNLVEAVEEAELSELEVHLWFGRKVLIKNSPHNYHAKHPKKSEEPDYRPSPLQKEDKQD